ncbi:hypothetical protein [Daejeonella oryzae]|uniref:hypothetical protein n=1 Tax=Daejeonella oryzae TaxID=1122943 RepID=UPI0003FE95FE|nr:hypothetical protein [Daejeonella oryzae]
MEEKSTFWERLNIHEWFLTGDEVNTSSKPQSLTPNDVYTYILNKFNESITELSFANRQVFYHEFIICFSPDDFKEFMDNKQGIFGLIVHESVKKFYLLLQDYRNKGKTVEPSSSKWVFRFVSHPDYQKGDMGFMGKLLPGSDQKEENLRVTFIPRQTGIAQTYDVNQEILKGFTFYSEGYYEVPYAEELQYDEKNPAAPVKTLARLETILHEKEFSGKRVEYLMKENEILVSGKDETRDDKNIFIVPSDWVNTPHLQIRHNTSDGKFYLASFGEKTILNEKEVKISEINHPEWVELPLNSRIMLNGIIGINIFKS